APATPLARDVRAGCHQGGRRRRRSGPLGTALSCGMYAGCWKPAVDCAQLGNKRYQFAGILTGATGLEPATSGVTGRYELNRHGRLRPRITATAGISSPNAPAASGTTGYDPAGSV